MITKTATAFFQRLAIMVSYSGAYEQQQNDHVERVNCYPSEQSQLLKFFSVTSRCLTTQVSALTQLGLKYNASVAYDGGSASSYRLLFIVMLVYSSLRSLVHRHWPWLAFLLSKVFLGTLFNGNLAMLLLMNLPFREFLGSFMKSSMITLITFVDFLALNLVWLMTVTSTMFGMFHCPATKLNVILELLD